MSPFLTRMLRRWRNNPDISLTQAIRDNLGGLL